LTGLGITLIPIEPECGENILDNQKNIAVKIINMKQRPTTTPTISPQDLVLVYLPKKNRMHGKVKKSLR
jgi:hypothetical protein